MDEQQQQQQLQQQPQPPTTKRRPGRPRTKPPTLEQRQATRPAAAQPSQAGQDPPDQVKPAAKPTIKASQVDEVVIRIPIGELTDGESYQTSRRGYPRQIRSRTLTEQQGQALAMIRLGMIRRRETLDGTKSHFIEGGQYLRPVETKEEVICRLLEYVAEAVDNAGDGEEKK